MIIASIDAGTNTIILLIAEADIDNKTITPLYNEQRIPRIGKGLSPGRPISEEKVDELLIVFEDYKSIIKRLNCEKTIITATNAFRIASNAYEIKKIVKEKFDFDINIVSGEEEADLTFNGAVFSFKDELNNIVIDIGGGSTEIILGNITEIKFKKSYQLGVVSAKEKYLKHSPPLPEEISRFTNKVEQTLAEIKEMNFEFNRAIAIAGTPTTLAAINLNLKKYDEDLLEGYILNYKEIERLIWELSGLNESQVLNKYKSVVKGREDVIFSGSVILLSIMRLLKINEIIVSTKGIRYGAICKELFNM
jgi:exopolyphosphatase/guanosine-5'-triphosphate,3'-diphosphate pyrophosphatase